MQQKYLKPFLFTKDKECDDPLIGTRKVKQVGLRRQQQPCAVLAPLDRKTQAGSHLNEPAAATATSRPAFGKVRGEHISRAWQSRHLQEECEQGGISTSSRAGGIRTPSRTSSDTTRTILATSSSGSGSVYRGVESARATDAGHGKAARDKETEALRVSGAIESGKKDDGGGDAGSEDSNGQVESRTPPAMERNLFLSALANGKLEPSPPTSLPLDGSHLPSLAILYHRDDIIITLKRILAGGLAGMLAKSVVAPVDRVKILFQVTNEKFSFNKAEKLLRDILALEGPAGLWKGNSATMIRVFPYAGTQFMMFDSLKRWALLRKTRHDPDAVQRLSNVESLISGSIAGGISALATYPLDLARARLAVGHSRKVEGRRISMGVPELLRSVVRRDGFLALYRGVVPSLMGIIPYAGIAFSINEHAKHEVLVLTGKEPGMMHKLGIGAFAGLVAQSCTYPLEVTRRRMQTHGLVDTHAGVHKVIETPKPGEPIDPERMRRLNIIQTLTAVTKEQGVRGLFKGLSMNWVKGPVGISISFTMFDFLKRRLDIA